jgi:hypothetical protein
MTLEDLAEEADWQRTYSTWGGVTPDFAVNLEDDEPTIRFGSHEVPATRKGVEALASFFNVPVKFVERIQPDERQFLLERRIERTEPVNVIVEWTTEGLREVRKASSVRLVPAEILDAALEVMPKDSLVVDWTLDSTDLLIDTVVPIDHDRYTGGDKVGDITKGGLRIGQNRKQNLAPWVQPYLYRLRCTNGLELPDKSLKIDARGMDEIEIIGSLRQNARLAMDGITEQIEHFYDLRSQSLGRDTTGVLHRVARENEIPERTIVALEDAFTGYLQEDFGITAENEASMFHLVNFLTNFANNEDLALSSQHRLQRLGGTLVNDHAQRCSACLSRLN